jgi:hypothetical protein
MKVSGSRQLRRLAVRSPVFRPGDNAVMIRPAPAVAVPLVLVPTLGLAQGGFSPDAWVWLGALAAWGAALAVVLSDDAGALRSAWPWLGCAVALLAWTLGSTLWSAHVAQSVLETRRTLCYVAVLLALVALARRSAVGAIVVATHVAITSLILSALLRYLFGAHHATEFSGYLLSDPLGYANAVGIIAAFGILLGLGIGSRMDSRRGRAGAAATLPPLALALELTSSHATWLALAVGLGAALLLDEAPFRVLRILVAIAAPSILLVLLGRRSGFSELATPRIDGWLLALATAGCMLVAAAIAGRRLGVPRTTPRRPPVWVLVAATTVGVGIAAALVVVNGVTSEPRASYYRVAWHDEYVPHPLFGSGAGTFALYWARSGHVASRGGALDVHSLYLETLAELGPLGLVLLLATLLYPLRAAFAYRRVPYVPAAASAYVAFLVHAGLDWDWEMPVVVVAALSCAAAVVSGAIPRARPLSTRLRAVVLIMAVALAGFAMAGVRSHTEPAAQRGLKKEAPQTRGLRSFTSVEKGYGLP